MTFIKMTSVVLQLPQTLNVQEPAVIAVPSGINGKLVRITNPNSVNNSNLVFNEDPNDSYVIDRNVIIKYTMRVKIDTSVAGGGKPDISKLAFRNFPLNRACTNASLDLGSQVFSTVPSQNIDLLMDYNGAFSEMYALCSGTPYAKDMRQDYNENGSRSEFISRNELQDGFVNHGRNLLHTITFESVSGDVTGNLWWLVGTFWEPIFLSPLLQFNDEHVGLYKLNKFNLTLNLSGQTKHVLSLMPGSDYSVTSTYDLVYAEMRSVWYSPSGRLAKPIVNFFNAPLITMMNTTSQTPIAYGEVQTQTSQNQRFSSGVPNLIGIYVGESQAMKDVTSTDTFATIENMSITFGTNAGNLSTFDIYDLWRMSRENGYTGGFNQFVAEGSLNPLGDNKATGRGSVVMIKPGKDIFTSDDGITGGMSDVLNFQATITYRNGAKRTIVQPTIYIFSVYIRQARQDENGNIDLITNYISEDMVNIAYEQYNTNPQNVTVHTIDNIQGGVSVSDVFSTLKRGWKGTKPLRTIGNIVRRGLAPVYGSIPGLNTGMSVVNPALDIGETIGDQVFADGRVGGRRRGRRI